MKVHTDEMALARAYCATQPFEPLSDDQMLRIMNRGRALYHWFKAHRGLHYAINTSVLAFLFGADYWVQVELPRWFLAAGGDNPAAAIVLTACLACGLHSWLMYSLSVFSMHEGAAHHIIFPPEGPISRAAHWVSMNLCRLGAALPEQYAAHHMSHHAKFGTEEDGEFLNFVKPRRFWLTLLPLGFEFDYSDFLIHRPPGLSWKRFASGLIALVYHGAYAWYAWTQFGMLYVIVGYLLVLPHVGFYLDRIRQFTEHNLMPLDNRNGSRSFGMGFWGLLVGGGPWGSPCHWEHHLVASLPWYQQLVLHRYVASLLTPTQRRQFLIEPVIGFPKLWWRLVREPNRFAALGSSVPEQPAG